MSFLAVSNGSFQTTSPITVAHTAPGGTGLVFACLFVDNGGGGANKPTDPTATWDGNAMTLIGAKDAYNCALWIWYYQAPVCGASKNVVVSWSNGSVHQVGVSVLSYTDLAVDLGSFVTEANNNATSGSLNVSTQIGDTVIDFVVDDTTSTLTPGGSQTAEINLPAGTGRAETDKIATSTTTTISFSLGTSVPSMGHVAFACREQNGICECWY